MCDYPRTKIEAPLEELSQSYIASGKATENDTGSSQSCSVFRRRITKQFFKAHSEPGMSHKGLLVYFFLMFLNGAWPLILKEVVVPGKVLARIPTTLSCNVDLDGGVLESLKWYKDDSELCAYSPIHSVDQRPLDQVLIKLERLKCGNSSLQMVPLSAAASGTYKCVVTALIRKATTKQITVQSVMASRNLSVFAYPLDPPLISGLKTVYRPGDYIEASCAAPPSYPPAQLYWTLNDEQVNQHHTYSKAEDEKGLLRSIIGLKMMVNSTFFKNPDGYALLVCTSVLVDSSPLSTSKKIYYSSKLKPQIQEEEEQPDRKRHAPQSKGSNKAVHLVSICITVFSLVCHFAT